MTGSNGWRSPLSIGTTANIGFSRLRRTRAATPIVFFYDVPVAGADELEIELSFRATDDRGNMRCVRLLLRADPDASLLPERSSITLYSPHSGKVDGLSFATCQPLLCATSAPEEVDLYVAADGQADPEMLPRRWRTGSDVLFTKASGFDYAAATKVALASVYEHSVKTDFVDDLAVDDIIIAGHGPQVWGAIKIVGVFDEPGSEYDRYLIHVKTFAPADISSPLGAFSSACIRNNRVQSAVFRAR